MYGIYIFYILKPGRLTFCDIRDTNMYNRAIKFCTLLHRTAVATNIECLFNLNLKNNALMARLQNQYTSRGEQKQIMYAALNIRGLS